MKPRVRKVIYFTVLFIAYQHNKGKNLQLSFLLWWLLRARDCFHIEEAWKINNHQKNMRSSQNFASAIPKNKTKTCISEATLCWACTNYIFCEFFFIFQRVNASILLPLLLKCLPRKLSLNTIQLNCTVFWRVGGQFTVREEKGRGIE